MRSTPGRSSSPPTSAWSSGKARRSSGRCSRRSPSPCRSTRLTHSSLYVGFFGLAGLIPTIAFGLYGGAIADVVDRGKLYFWSSILAMGDDARPACADAARPRQRLADPRAGRGAGRRVRDRIVDTRRDHAATRPRRPRARGQHTDLHRRQLRPGRRPADRGPARRPEPRLRLRLRHRRGAVHRSALLGVPPAADAAGREFVVDARAALGRRRPAVHRHPSRRRHVVPRRHRARWCWPCRARCSRPSPTSASTARSDRSTPRSRSAR